MMGRQRRDQGRLFYEFRLEDRIPENHMLRRMNVFVTAALADLHKELEPYYSDIGRPSIDPELARPADFFDSIGHLSPCRSRCRHGRSTPRQRKVSERLRTNC